MSGSGLSERFPSSGPDPILSEQELEDLPDPLDELLTSVGWDLVDMELALITTLEGL